MGANILWEPIKERHDRYIATSTPSGFQEAMSNAGLTLPIKLGPEDVPVLKGMAAVCSGNNKNPYQQIIDLIDKYGSINVWAEY